jgi:hypothetical protein
MMVAVGVPMWGDVGGGFDVWLPVYVALALILVVWITGRLTLRGGVVAIAIGMLWSWSTNHVGVVVASCLAILLAMIVGGLLRRRARSRYDGPDPNTGFSAK